MSEGRKFPPYCGYTLQIVIITPLVITARLLQMQCAMSYLCQNMKLFVNKLDKLQLFCFFDYSLTKKEKVSPTVIR